MFSAISERVTNKLVKAQKIHDIERESCRYGIQQGLAISLNFITTISIGLIFKSIWRALVFSAAYILLRCFAGGYHAKTPERCYIFSAFMIATVLSAMRFIVLTKLVCSGMMLASGLVIIAIAPVQDINKPLDYLERRVYKRRTLLIMSVEIVLTTICMALDWYSLTVCLTMAITVMAVMLALGQTKNMFANNATK